MRKDLFDSKLSDKQDIEALLHFESKFLVNVISSMPDSEEKETLLFRIYKKDD